MRIRKVLHRIREASHRIREASQKDPRSVTFEDPGTVASGSEKRYRIPEALQDPKTITSDPKSFASGSEKCYIWVLIELELKQCNCLVG